VSPRRGPSWSSPPRCRSPPDPARHRKQTPEEDDFEVRTLEEIAATRNAMAQTMTMLLMSVASVSLLVGGIGS